MTDQPERADTCASCEFYHESGPDKDLNRSTMCRRFPPSAFPMPRGNTLASISIYPPVQSTQWCGEWKKSTRIVLQ
jgi:hypothetical protein